MAFLMLKSYRLMTLNHRHRDHLGYLFLIRHHLRPLIHRLHCFL
jgi:hypothetical protein